ncbi:jg16644 [Pararge aegeria aegeria]|uniref:Jg16644 protein n=1 Tax=Pararge aegeria aegeria TaxID=348720 RepID=A0A8S4REN3_9NEOP|nr:jg16644 [Pararge aegeria aegeria]
MDSNRLSLKEENVRNYEEIKKTGCWAKFKSLFEERGFDLEFEYNDNATTSEKVLKEHNGDNNANGYRKNERRNLANKKPDDIVNIDGELSGVINFYEQFASLSDDTKEEVFETKRRSTFRPRVSMRPSILLTNIIEETGDGDVENFQEVRI